MPASQCTMHQNDHSMVMEVHLDGTHSETSVVCVQLFCNVTNMVAVKEQAMSGSLPVALVRPSMVGGLPCVLAAALAAVTAHSRHSLKTRSLATEILFSLSPHTKIASALQQFGALDTETSVLAVTVDKHSDVGLSTAGALTPTAKKVRAAIVGEPADVSTLEKLTDVAAVTKLYKLSKEELKMGSISEACLSRMACRGFL